MNTVSKSFSPEALSTASAVTSMMACLPSPLSWMSVTVSVTRIVPSTGISLWSVIAWAPWTRRLQSISPTEPMAPPPIPTITAKVGSTRWVMPWLFSVVNSSSNPVGSMAPAPTPRAYRRQSLEFHDRSVGPEVTPTAFGLIGMSAT